MLEHAKTKADTFMEPSHQNRFYANNDMHWMDEGIFMSMYSRPNVHIWAHVWGLQIWSTGVSPEKILQM